MKDIILGASIALNVIIIGIVIAFLMLPTRFVTCDRDGQCYEMDVTYGEYIFGRD